MAKRYLNLSLRAWQGLIRRYPSATVALQNRISYFSLGCALSALEAFTPKLPPTALKDPLFLVGHWRSGTTILHELVTAGGHFGFPTTFACMNPQRFLAAGQPSNLPAMKSSRPMDDIVLHANSPQEDEFALLMLGAPSPYEYLIFPEAMEQTAARCQALSTAEQDAWRQAFAAFSSAVQRANGERPIAFKSPAHSFRIAELFSAFPNARFLGIVRHPEDVFASTRKYLHAMWDLYALSRIPEDRQCAEAIAATMYALDAAMTRDFSMLPDGRGMLITYEDLIRAPHQILAEIGRKLAIPSLMEENPDREELIRGLKPQRQAGRTLLSKEERDLLGSMCAPLYGRHEDVILRY